MHFVLHQAQRFCISRGEFISTFVHFCTTVDFIHIVHFQHFACHYLYTLLPAGFFISFYFSSKSWLSTLLITQCFTSGLIFTYSPVFSVSLIPFSFSKTTSPSTQITNACTFVACSLSS